MDDTQYGVRELKPADHKKIRELVRAAPSLETVFIRPIARDLAGFDGWWQGALEGGQQLVTIMAIKDHVAHLYSASHAATKAMATALMKKQEILKGVVQAARHQLIGEAETVGTFWRSFSSLHGRTLISDKRRPLMVSGPAPEASPSKRVKLGYAPMSDLRVVVEFRGEQQLERDGTDPRRLSPQAHATRCQQLIAEKKIVVGRDEDKPILVAELVELDSATVLLDGLWIPPAFRGRKRLIGGALYLARKAPQAKGKQLLYFADDESAVAAGELAGYEQKAEYRHITSFG